MQESRDTKRLIELLQAGKSDPLNAVDTSTLRYALYVRKSTTSEDRQASSIEDQIRDCTERIITPGNLNIVKVYQESFSAKVADMREQFNAMIDSIENGQIDGVIAWHPDRLSRNMKEAGTIIDLVDRGLIRDLQFSTFTFENTPAGKMLLGITFVMAKQYSEHLAESVDRGNKRAVEDGEFIGKFKHGYVINANRNFDPDPRNFTKIKHMFQMALEGKSQKEMRLWINEQNYTVQKRPQGEYVTHLWSKDDVSKLIRDPHYAGVHKWGKSLTDLLDLYDFERMISVQEFLKINRIDNLNSNKVLALHSPRTSTKADLLRGMIYCDACHKTMTSMIIEKRYKDTGEIKEGRFYYKCETPECMLTGKSVRAGVVINSAVSFFQQYLFITQSNYKAYLEAAQARADIKAVEMTSLINKLKVTIANKEKAYEKTKELIRDNPELKSHYDLDKDSKEIELLKKDYKQTVLKRENIKNTLPAFKEYLKLIESTPVVLQKIRDMKTMDTLLRIFFSNFTIKPVLEGTFKGSIVSFELKEPWKGFLENDDFVIGAG